MVPNSVAKLNLIKQSKLGVKQKLVKMTAGIKLSDLLIKRI